MIDLAALFQEATAQHAAQDFPGFPTSAKPSAETQVSGIEQISGISDISDNAGAVNGLDQWKAAQARAGAGAGERARDVPAEVPEMPEMPEKLEPARTWLSDFPSGKLKKEREVGNSPALPGALTPAAAPEFEERAAFLEYDCGLTRLAAEAQARAECRQAERAPPVARPSVAVLPRQDGLALWRAGIAALSLTSAPCPGYRGDEWERTRSRALDFLDAFGAQAEALGWTAGRLFGVHPVAGIVRVDHCGALVLPVAGTVRAITATEIRFDHLTHREKPGQPQGVPWWEFGR